MAQRPGWEELRVAAFNIQVFGRSKMKSTKISQVLGQIISRYDIVLVQEVRDKSGKAIGELQKLADSHTAKGTYKLTISKRLGRTSSKEQYAFLYRHEEVEVVDVFQFDDSDIGDVFHRDPYCVKFKIKHAKSGLSEFAVIGIHTDPDEAKEEIENLTTVHEAVTKRWNIEDVVIMGDLNADLNYVKGGDFVDIDLFTDDKFHWLIGNEEDTTVTDTHAAYDRRFLDRMVVTGEKLLAAIKQDSVGPFHFDEEYGLTDEEARHISDHYPIEMTLQISERVELPQLHGQLVRTADTGSKVWMINEFGRKVEVPEGAFPALFEASEDNIHSLPDRVGAIREDDALASNATLAKADDDDVYLISNGMKRIIKDRKTADRFHFNLHAAVTVPPVVLDSIPLGKPIQYPDPTLRRSRKRGKADAGVNGKGSSAKSART